jgi:beta-lactamase superfamily II metal-dependent hydrolase
VPRRTTSHTPRIAGLFLLACASLLAAADNLRVYAIDVEGGKSTLYVSPSGESMLVDAGYAGFHNRDADRIAAAARAAGVKQIDYLVVTHYHADHVGGVAQLAARLPIRAFFDHGKMSVALDPDAKAGYNAYLALRAKGPYTVVKPGDTIPIKGIQVEVVTAAGEAIASALPGAGQPNPLCATYHALDEDGGENAYSIGMLIAYGNFRLADLGDLFWNQEHDLACPDNKLGVVDVYMTTHHGARTSGSPQMVDALHPKVAIMNNGADKGGSVEAWQTIHDSPGLVDLWQLHFSNEGGKAHNVPEAFIANPSVPCQGKWIELTAQKDGTFTVVAATASGRHTGPDCAAHDAHY